MSSVGFGCHQNAFKTRIKSAFKIIQGFSKLIIKISNIITLLSWPLMFSMITLYVFGKWEILLLNIFIVFIFIGFAAGVSIEDKEIFFIKL